MPWTYVPCPVCQGEIEVEVREGIGGYPEEVLVEVTDWKRSCRCKLTPKQIWEIEEAAINRADFSYEGD